MVKNSLYLSDCIDLLSSIEDNAIDCVLTDPPYLYLAKAWDAPFNEEKFFEECKRVLKPDGFIILFGRGSSFYRWNVILSNLCFKFKEEIIWDKAYITSPLMPISRIHETISIHTKRSGTLNKVKIPYLEMKKHDINSICVDLKRFLSGIKNEKSLKEVYDFLKEGKRVPLKVRNPTGVTISSPIYSEDRAVSVMRSFKFGFNEKTIIRGDFQDFPYKDKDKDKDIISDNINYPQNSNPACGEKSIIRHPREHYSTIHPTQKPVRLLERLLDLVSKENDTILDPFSGSGSTAIACIKRNRFYICGEKDEGFYALSANRIAEEKTKHILQELW